MLFGIPFKFLKQSLVSDYEFLITTYNHVEEGKYEVKTLENAL